MLNFTDPFFTTRVLGFEPLFDRFQKLSESSQRSSSYPPYNIKRVGNIFEIEIAVAGLSKNDILIELTNGIDEDHNLVYRGIAKRAFKQQFTLAEDVVVLGAELENGLLLINLEKIIPEEKKPKIIDIKTPKKILGKK
jgi:molecular chaperone IbpA